VGYPVIQVMTLLQRYDLAGLTECFGTSTQYTKKRVKHGAFACIFVMFYMQKNCGNTEYLNEWLQKFLSPLNK